MARDSGVNLEFRLASHESLISVTLPCDHRGIPLKDDGVCQHCLKNQLSDSVDKLCPIRPVPRRGCDKTSYAAPVTELSSRQFEIT